jgi:EAL and modified HD-GYP domain-containing signal transduction protein
MDVWVARQPIFDRRRQLYAYELLFRSEAGSNQFDGTEAASATTQVIANSVLGIGLDHILCGKKAFLNFDRNLLLGNLHSILPKENTVLEILETVEADDEVLAICKDLHEQGYALALDDFVCRPETERLTEFAELIKVDLRTTTKQEQMRLLATYRPRGIRMLAEKVETLEEFRWAWNAGYDYFQGYFFARPAVMRGRQIPAVKVTCLDLLREVQQAELDFDRLQALIENDVSLSYQLLRYVNSALFSSRVETHTIHNGLARLGEDGIRHWAVLATLPILAQDKPGELIVLSLVRAHFCDCLSKLAHLPAGKYAYLMGLFSLIDALIDLPLKEALQRADVAPVISGALLEIAGEHDPYLNVHRLAGFYESGAWEEVSRLAGELGIRTSAIGKAYAVSTRWAQDVLHRRPDEKVTARKPAASCFDTCGECLT